MKHLNFWRRQSLMIIVLPLLSAVLFESSECLTAHSTTTNELRAQQERVFKTGTPKHVPIKITFKNINSDRWAHDLEIEITNKSDRPIYYLSFNVHPQYVASGIEQFAFWVHYGRPQLNNFSTPIEDRDVPLLPDETCILKLNEPDADGWEQFRIKHNIEQPAKIGLVFQALNFGDGTGFVGAQGTAVNKKNRP